MNALPDHSAQEAPPLLSTIRPDRGQQRAALAVLCLALAIFLAAAPSAKVQLPALWAFLPAYQSVYIVITLITAVLLLGQFRMLRSRGLLLLAGGYLFDALMAAAHALSFPGLFAPAGLLGAGPQTTAWLYFLWHGGFPLFVIGYALLKGGRHDTLPTHRHAGAAILAAGLAVLALSSGLILLATLGHDLLPAIMQGNLDASTKVVVATLTWLFSVAALIALWRRRPHALLDIWLMVVMCVWILDTALAAVLNHGRFDVGWYAGRVCGLLAGGMILVILLLENSVLYQQLAHLRSRDIKQSSARLAESELRFRRLFDEAPMPLCLVDKEGTLAHRNQRFERTFGDGKDELRSLDAWLTRSCTDPDDRARARAAWQAAVTATAHRGTDIAAHEYRVRCMDGSERIMLISGSTLGEDLLLSFFDVTARRQAEQALSAALEQQRAARLATLNQMEDAIAARAEAEAARQEVLQLNAELERRVQERTAELSAANRELDAFAYAVSHDLRAPLRAMSGFSQALAEDYGSQLQGEARTYLEQIDIASRRMAELVDGLLVLSRSTRGELRRDTVDISALAARLLGELADAEPARRVATEVEDGLAARGDARMIEVALRNLLANAWKYTGKTAAPLIRVYAGKVGEHHGICVADNGAGFDMDHANRLFQPFQRLHRQDEFPGIGIGLATVQRIVHRHGGAIAAHGEPGKGAAFCFSLHEENNP